MIQRAQTLQHRVSKSDVDADADAISQNRQIGYRVETLHDHARAGYRLTHTVTIESDKYVTFADTLVRDNDDQ